MVIGSTVMWWHGRHTVDNDVVVWRHVVVGDDDDMAVWMACSHCGQW